MLQFATVVRTSCRSVALCFTANTCTGVGIRPISPSSLRASCKLSETLVPAALLLCACAGTSQLMAPQNARCAATTHAAATRAPATHSCQGHGCRQRRYMQLLLLLLPCQKLSCVSIGSCCRTQPPACSVLVLSHDASNPGGCSRLQCDDQSRNCSCSCHCCLAGHLSSASASSTDW